jgi:hypothetical protein
MAGISVATLVACFETRAGERIGRNVKLMTYDSCQNSLLRTGTELCFMLRIVILTVIAALVSPSFAQNSLPAQTREVRKFSLFFEANQIVELELATDHPDEIRKYRFLRIELLDGNTRVAVSEFNLASLPIVKISANPTGYGKAEITVNGYAGELVTVRNNRIRLFGRIAVSSIKLDPETGGRILIPDPTNLKGLTTIVDKDGGRRTLTLIMTKSVESTEN